MTLSPDPLQSHLIGQKASSDEPIHRTIVKWRDVEDRKIAMEQGYVIKCEPEASFQLDYYPPSQDLDQSPEGPLDMDLSGFLDVDDNALSGKIRRGGVGSWGGLSVERRGGVGSWGGLSVERRGSETADNTADTT